MSPAERQLPQPSEELHLPGPSLQPVLLTVGITLALIGVTFNPVLLIIGLVLTIWQTVNWIRDCRAEVNELPLDHDAH